MSRIALATVVTTLAVGSLAGAQQPPVQNGRVEVRQAADLAGEIRTLAAGATDPVWVGWRAAMIGGPRSLCNWYVDEDRAVRGFLASTGAPGASSVPQITPPTGPVPIEAGTGLVVLARLVDGRVERLRTLTDDCPVDAGGRTIYWFDGIAAARSLAYLDSLTRLDGLDGLDRNSANARRSLARGAVSAIALHADSGADAILDRLASPGGDTSLRRQAISQLGAHRDQHGFDTLRRLIGSETDASVQRALVQALAQTGRPQAADTLLSLARNDADARVRAEAAYRYLQLAGEAGVTNTLAIIDGDAETEVKHRAIQGLFALPDSAGVPHLITLARTSAHQTVRHEAVEQLGRTKDPRAIAYLTELLSGKRPRN
jgi:hypothetical protein